MLYFQTFYVSKEESNCPLIVDALRVRKKIIDLNFKDIIISQRYGKRILINSNNFNEDKIKEYFLEIVDYDPIKNIQLVMGPNDPRIETPLHWFIHHARNEVNVVVQINDEELSDKLKDIPMTQKDYSVLSLEQIKEVLKHLKDSKKVIIKNQGLIFVGNNIKEVENQISEVIK